jgi:L-alanine-DL-glutamate epimerase-like enolase superfamily enzyme
VIHLRGGGHIGSGEDVCYEPEEHEPLHTEGLAVDLRGRATFAEISDRLDCDLFPTRAPEMPVSRAFRRWGIESAALDLALRQKGTSFAQTLGLEPSPVRFVASMHLDPPDASRLRALRSRVPDVRFKLDGRSDWDENLIDEIATLGGVEIIDLKGRYEGTIVDQAPDPDLYRRVADAFPGTLIEDPALTPETESALGPSGLARVSWDAPIHSLADVAAQPAPAAAVNVKPSRIGSVEELLRIYESLAQARIPMYGGGQMELGPGRGHIQLLASLFHPHGPNDVAPTPYNLPSLPETLPPSPIPVSAGGGFSWEM